MREKKRAIWFCSNFMSFSPIDFIFIGWIGYDENRFWVLRMFEVHFFTKLVEHALFLIKAPNRICHALNGKSDIRNRNPITLGRLRPPQNNKDDEFWRFSDSIAKTLFPQKSKYSIDTIIFFVDLVILNDVCNWNFWWKSLFTRQESKNVLCQNFFDFLTCK